MIESQNKVRLGELLVDSEIVSSADLTEAIQVSTRLNIPIGRVLLLSGLVSPVTLEAALEAQPLLNDEKESRTNVIKALKEVDCTGKSLNKMLPSSGDGRDVGLGRDKLAELLLDSEIVSQDQLDQALSTSFEAGVPLGSALVLEGILSPSLFPSILRIQQNVRTGSISKDEAIEEVKSTFMHWLKAEESLSGKDFAKTSKTLEDSIEEEVLYENVNDSDKDKIKLALENHQPVSITFEPHSNEDKGRLVDLLIEAGTFTKADIESAILKTMNNPQKSAELFQLLGLVDQESKKDAIKCFSLLKSGQLSKQEAKYVLDSKLSQPLLSADKEEQKIKGYFDKNYRKSVFSKVVGGMVVGVAFAGISILKNRGK